MDPSSSRQRPLCEHMEEDRTVQWEESWPGMKPRLTVGAVCTQLPHLL